MLVIIHPDFMCIIQYTVSAISHFRHYKSSASYAGVWDSLLHLSGLLNSIHSTVIILGREDFLAHHLKTLSISFKQNVCYILWHLVGKGIIFKQSSLPTPTNCLLSPFVAKVEDRSVVRKSPLMMAVIPLVLACFALSISCGGELSTFQDICIRSYGYYFM